MGAWNVHTQFDGSLSHTALRKQFADLQARLTREFGTDPYNGTFSTCNGLAIHDRRVFTNEEEAMNYTLDHTDKRGPAVAVPLERDGTRVWLLGGWAAM
jgi:hypothetical protein